MKTILISRHFMNFTSKIKVDFNLQRTVLAHFGNNLDFKATHEFYLDFKSTLIKKNSSSAFWKQPWFQGNSWILPQKSRLILTFKEQFWRILKTTWISRQFMNFTLISCQPWFKKTVLAHFENSLDFKATWIFRNVSLASSEEGVNIFLFNDGGVDSFIFKSTNSFKR